MRRLIAFFLVVLTSCTSLQVQEKPPTAKYLYDNITIEIQQTNSISIIQSDLTALKSSLHKYRICRKNRISIIVKNPVPAPAAWTRSTMMHFKRKHRTLFDRNPYDRHLIVHISLLPGIYLERGGNIIGLAFKSNQYIALFNNFSHFLKQFEVIDYQAKFIIQVFCCCPAINHSLGKNFKIFHYRNKISINFKS